MPSTDKRDGVSILDASYIHTSYACRLVKYIRK